MSTQVESLVCPRCRSTVPDGTLRCPFCDGLIHGPRLNELAQQAKAAEADGRWPEARAAWREALDLLPPETQQYASVKERIDHTVAQAGADVAANSDVGKKEESHKFGWLGKAGGPAVAGAVLLWKFKAFVLLLLSKGKLLLLGLTKVSTLVTMFASFGVYWGLYGWAFGALFVLSIYVHEIGHVWALRRLGIRASAPMFIPLFGAVVFLRQRVGPKEDAKIGLAGPAWGLWAAVACYAIYQFTGIAVFGVAAHFGAAINLFNLIPVWTLDGSRGFHALDRRQRLLAVLLCLALWAIVRDGMLFLVAAAGAWRLFTKDWPVQGHWRALGHFAWLVAGLALLIVLPFPRSH